jgi:DNA-binding SARP family transcriptional activator/alpha-beta hydrolase superfamily lysophospholipase
MEFRVLGPLGAVHDGEPVAIGGPRQQTVLALLLAFANRPVSIDRLVDEIWGEAPPPAAKNSLQSMVSKLRSAFPDGTATIERDGPGYSLKVDPGAIDAKVFAALVEDGGRLLQGEPTAAADVLRKALDLWRGRPYEGVSDDSAALRAETVRLEELRLAGLEQRVEADLASGRAGELVGELEALVGEYPLRERFRGQLMLALYRSGRQSEALRVYQRTRHVLGEELGIEPSPELRDLEQKMLLQDRQLETATTARHPTVPPIRYATTSDGTSIAYYTLGSGGIDLLYVSGWVSNLETLWEHELPASFYQSLASFSRLICFDKRGTGLSDRVPVDRLPDLDTRVTDIKAVLDAAGTERAALFGVSEGGPLAATFAALHPERTRGLVLFGSYAARRQHPDYPWAPSEETRERWLAFIENEWGGKVDLRTMAPSRQDDAEFRRWWSRYLRSGASPAAALALGRMNTDVDIRSIAPLITVPTLVLHRAGDLDAPVEGARWLADHIHGASYVELPGSDHLVFIDPDEVLTAVQAFLADVASHP